MFVSINMPTASPAFIAASNPRTKVVFVYDPVSVHCAISRHQPVEIYIVQPARHDLHGMAVERMRKGRKLPTAEMRGQKKHTLAVGAGAFVVFERVIRHDLVDVFRSVLWKPADLGQLTAQGCKLGAQNARPLRVRFFWKRELKIAHSNLPQSDVKKINNPSQSDAGRPRHRPWQDAKGFYKRPRRRVLESLPHRGKRDGSTAGNYLQTDRINHHRGTEHTKAPTGVRSALPGNSSARCGLRIGRQDFRGEAAAESQLTSQRPAPISPERSGTHSRRRAAPLLRSAKRETRPYGRKTAGCCSCLA